MERRDTLPLFGLTLAGILSCKLLGFELFNTTDFRAQCIVAIVGLAFGLLVAYGCLITSGLDRKLCWLGALWGIVPWYFLFASQMAYLGFLLIPFEIFAGAGFLKWKTSSSATLATATSFLSRTTIFAVHFTLPPYLI